MGMPLIKICAVGRNELYRISEQNLTVQLFSKFLSKDELKALYPLANGRGGGEGTAAPSDIFELRGMIKATNSAYHQIMITD